MWLTHRKKPDTYDPCQHEEVTVSSSAGLRRTVCGDCGHVSVGYLYDVFEEQARQLIQTPEPTED